jgi:hypothetical protein
VRPNARERVGSVCQRSSCSVLNYCGRCRLGNSVHARATSRLPVQILIARSDMLSQLQNYLYEREPSGARASIFVPRLRRSTRDFSAKRTLVWCWRELRHGLLPCAQQAKAWPAVAEYRAFWFLRAASGWNFWRTTGARQTANTSRRDPAISLGPAVVANSLCRERGKRTMRETEVQIGNSGLTVCLRNWG